MVQYHLGLGIGHIYTHQSSHHVDEAVGNLESIGESIEEEEDQNQEVSLMTFGGVDANDLEHSLVVQDIDDLGDSETSETDRDEEQSDVDDELYAAM